MNVTGKRKIAIITPYGAQPRFDNYAEFILAQTLNERGWDVRLYTYKIRNLPEYRHDTVYKGLNVLRCRQRFGISPRLFLSILISRPEVVVSFHPKSQLSFTAYLAAKCIGAKYVHDIVGLLHDPYIVNNPEDPENNFKSPIRLATNIKLFFKELFDRQRAPWTNYICHMPLKHADGIVSMNTAEKKYVKEIYGRDSSLIYWATPRNVDMAAIKPKVALPERFFVFIGQIKIRKGWDTVLEAIAHLKKAGKEEHLVFVTPLKDLSVPKEYAKKLGVLENITFLSAISNEEKTWLLSHATYVCIPSRFEGFGVVVFEAFLAKRPILATTIPTYLEFLEDHKNSLLYERGDSEGLARAVMELDAHPELIPKLIAEGTKTAERFNYNKMTDEYIALFDSLKNH